MKSCLLTFLAICTLAPRISYGADSYREAAYKNLSSKVFEISEELEGLDDSITPKSVKKLRKDLGRVKLEIDLYCPLFSNKGSKLGELRDLIDDGYENLGVYKDLYDSNEIAGIEIDPKLEVERRAKVLKWKKLFVDFKSDNLEGEKFIPGKSSIKCAHKEKFIWSKINWIPNANDPLSTTLATLLSKLAKAYRADQKNLQKIDELFEIKNEEAFHDFRKGVRALLTIISTYQNEVAQQVNLAEVQVWEEKVDQFGEINDLLIAWHRAKKKEGKKLEKSISKKWHQLKKDLDDVTIRDLIY